MSALDDYRDLYMRAVAGGMAQPRMGGARSPDILPWGTGTLAQPDALAVPPLWDQDPGQALQPGVANNIYLRCGNGSSNDVPGHLYLAAGAPCLPCWPDQFTALTAPGGKAYLPMKATGGLAFATTTPFVYTPKQTNDTLAAWLVTSQHKPDPSAVLESVFDLQAFFANNPGYAQRSTAAGIDDTNTYSYAAQYAQRKQEAVMQIELRAHDCPLGWTLSVLPTQKDGPLQIQPFALTNRSQVMSVQALVHADYTDTLTLCIDTGGVSPDATARVDLLLSLLVPAAGTSAAHADDGSAPWVAACSGQSTLFRLGSHTWYAQLPATATAASGPTRYRSQP